MNYYTHLESSQFKVVNAKKFKDAFDAVVKGEHTILYASESGFVIYATNPYFLHPDHENRDTPEDDDMTWDKFLQPHLKDDSVVELTFVHMNSKNFDLGADFAVITKLGDCWHSTDSIFNLLKRDCYPRMVECLSSVKNHQTRNWIEEGKRYTALELIRKHTRWSYVIEHKDGNQVTWGKEYFKDVTSNS